MHRTGIADDKSIYPYLPDMIQFYLVEKPVLSNVPTHVCPRARTARIHTGTWRPVVKEVHGAGGYGMLGGAGLDASEREEFARRLRANPDNTSHSRRLRCRLAHLC